MLPLGGTQFAQVTRYQHFTSHDLKDTEKIKGITYEQYDHHNTSSPTNLLYEAQEVDYDGGGDCGKIVNRSDSSRLQWGNLRGHTEDEGYVENVGADDIAKGELCVLFEGGCD